MTKPKVLVIGAAATICWLVLYFVGYFFASSIFFPLAVLAILIVVYYFFQKTSKKMALILMLGTLLVATAVVLNSFEEDYCWKKGSEADPSGTQMVPATQEDIDNMKSYVSTVGQPIGASFRAHMLCHTSFNFAESLKEKYSFK